MKAVLTTLAVLLAFSFAEAKVDSTCHMRSAKKLENPKTKTDYAYLLNSPSRSKAPTRTSPQKAADGVKKRS